MTLVGNLWIPMRSSAPDHDIMIVPTVALILSHPLHSRVCLDERMGGVDDWPQALRM